MSLLFQAGKKPKPNPKRSPEAESTSDPSTGSDAGTGSGSGGSGSGDPDGSLLSGLGSWLWHHPISIPILLVAALIGANYGWSQLRKKQAARGVAVRPLGAITRDVLRFCIKEDTRPVHAKTPWLTGKRLYLGLLLLSVLAIVPGIPGIPGPIPLLALVFVVYARSRKIFAARKAVVAKD